MHKQVLTGGLPPKPAAAPASTKPLSGMKFTQEVSVLPWESCFSSRLAVCPREYPDVGYTGEAADSFNVYLAGNLKSPLVLLLLHGAGFSGLSWACMTAELIRSTECAVVALDLRGHGLTCTLEESDLSFERLSQDVSAVLASLKQKGTVNEDVRVFLIGHSMGGALAAHIAAEGCVPHICGTCVIDVVEGSAMDALSGMKQILSSRPKSFTSEEQAVEWALKSGYIRNRTSARVSMIGQLSKSPTHSEPSIPVQPGLGALTEEEEEERTEPGKRDESQQSSSQHSPCKQSKSDSLVYWRADLFKSEQFWTGWFTGLTNKFLAFSGPKLLLLAGVDRLDKDLTVAQMQGKFQMQILPKAGHAVHEDLPDKVADCLATFLNRHKFAQPDPNKFKPTVPCC